MMSDKITELKKYVDERLSTIDEAIRLLFLNSIAREIEIEVVKRERINSDDCLNKKKSDFELNVEVIHRPDEKVIINLLKPLGVKLKQIECLQKQQLAMLTCKNGWKIGDVRKISELFKEQFQDILPVFCASDMTVATKRLMTKENFNFIVKNKEFRIFFRR